MVKKLKGTRPHIRNTGKWGIELLGTTLVKTKVSTPIMTIGIQGRPEDPQRHIAVADFEVLDDQVGEEEEKIAAPGGFGALVGCRWVRVSDPAGRSSGSRGKEFLSFHSVLQYS